MKKYLIIFLVLNNLLFNYSCKQYKTLEKNTDTTKQLKSPFDNNFKKILFNTKIYFYKKYFSGLLFIKQIQANDYRIVFITEVGKKIFDFELTPENFDVKYIIPVIDKKILIKTLQKDFSLMLLNNLNNNNKIKYFYNDSIKKFKTKNNYGKIYLTYTNNTLTQLQNANKIRKIIFIDYKNYKNNFPQTIDIQHKNIKLKLKLKTIKQNVN